MTLKFKKRCVVCGTEFETRSTKKDYCSTMCKQSMLIKKDGSIVRQCLACGEEFNSRNGALYCSHQCRIRKQHLNRSNLHVLRRDVREYFFEKFNFKCVECGNIGRDLHHIVPLYCDGPDEEENIELLCADCHKKKHSIL